MLEIPINPTTQRQLRAFGRRRRLFAAIRGGLVALAVLMVVFFLIALIDWLFVMPNGVRWGLTITGYLATALTAWFLGIRDWLRPTTDVELARFMESAAPELREELLSAVELADCDPKTVRDSLEFRKLVQESVADRVANVEPRRLLPWARLNRCAVAASSGLAMVGILTLIVGISFASRLMMRAAVPGVNIARITGVEIDIVEPAPASLITRSGDPVMLRFRVSKPEVRVADLMLETEGRKRTVQLRPVEPGVFETTLHPNREPIDYSLAAGDAVTPIHQIDPHTPPVILDFNKRYQFPDYLSRETQDIRERDGHLKAIEGTTVKLQITSDQPSVGEIRLTMGGETKTIPLSNEGNQLSAEIPLADSGRYQIHLTGARSKLPAEFAPTYQITAYPDKAPRIRLIQPDTESVVQPDAVIPVQAQAEDDNGIARIEQWLSRNGGEDWEKFPIVSQTGRQTPVSFNWDLLNHHLEAGDLITTKLVAVDGRGEFAESREVDLTINFRDLDPERLAGLRARDRALAILEELSENSSTTFDSIKEGLKNDSADLSKLYEMDREAWSAMARLRTPLQSVPPGRDAYDLNLAARSAALGRHLGIRQAIRRAPFARSLRDSKARTAHLESTSTDVSSALRRYGAGRELVRSMIAEELPRVALGDFLELRRQTELLLPDENQNGTRNPNADELRRFGRVLGLTLHRARAITHSLGEFEVSWRNAQAEKLHEVAEAVGPRLEGLSLDLESLRADDRKSRSAINQLGPWWELGAIPFVDFNETFRREFAPELAIELSKPVEGQRWSNVPDWDEGGLRELAQPGTVVYLFRTVTASKENVVQAEISCREGVSVWLNGEVWVQNRSQRSSHAERYRMNLQPGQNNLLVKLVNRRHPHPFSFRIENGRLEGDVDELATEADKLRFLSLETKSVLDDAIRALQPILLQMADFTARRRTDNEREAAETRSLAAALQRLVGRSIYFGIGIEQGKKIAPRERDYLDEVPKVKWTPYTDALDSFAWLDEIRPDADTAFCRATGFLARAFESMRPEFLATAKATPNDFPDTTRYSPQTLARRQLDGRMKTLSEEFLLLERAYEIREIERAVRELASQEEWRSQGPEPRTRHPFEWRFISQRLEHVGLKISQGSDAIEAGAALLDVFNCQASKQISRQMEQRLTTLDPLINLRPQFVEIRTRLTAIIEQMENRESVALAAIQAEAPSLTELIATAADASKDLAKRSRQAVVEIADADETVAFARTRKLFLSQQRNDRLVRNVMNALRQDANSQNVLLSAGRQRSRDTDAALEWLRLPAKLSAAAYEDALFAETPREQRHFLEDGGLNQGTIANRLDELRRHFQSLDKGEWVAPFRAELRELELEFEIRERLDGEYGQLERVAKMAKLRQTSELIAALEGELDGNGAMQRELDALTQNAAQDSLTNLQRAAMAEAEIRQRLKNEAVRQGESRPAMTKPEIQKAISVAEADVSRLRRSATNLRESHLSLRAQHQQLRQRHQQFQKATTDFLDIELPAIAVAGLVRVRESQGDRSLTTSATDLATVVESLKQASKTAQKKLLAENGDLAELDFTDELTVLKSSLAIQRKTVTDISGVPTDASETFQESLHLFDSALERFPIKHAGNVRVASYLYQRCNEIRNAAARLDATSEAALKADQQVIAAKTQLTGKQHEELASLVRQFRELVETRMPDTVEQTRLIGATDAATNHTEATKDAATALALAPKPDADLLSLSQNLDQLGLRLKDAGTEMIRAARTTGVQVEGPAKVAYSAAVKLADNIQRVQNQARLQRDLQARAINATRPRGNRMLPEDEKRQKLQEAAEAGKRAAELSRQAERMAANNTGDVEKTKAFLNQVTATLTASNDDGKLAQKLGDQFRNLADQVEAQVAALQPRQDSDAGRTAKRIAEEVAAVNDLAAGIEKLALQINPKVHAPSEAEIAARQADEARERAAELLAEETELASGPHPDDVLSQIEEAQQADTEARNQLARAEHDLHDLQVLEALPEPDPNPERSQAAIVLAADEQSQVIEHVNGASGSLVRAALHEQRLGHRVNARELGRLAKRTHALADSGLPSEAQEIRAATKLLPTAAIAERAENSIRTEMKELREFLFPEATVEARTAEAETDTELTTEPLSERDAEVSHQLARVLFQVQEQIPGETLLAKLELIEQGTQSAVEKDYAESEQPETALAKPANAPTQPENAPAQPENTPSQPENQPTQPENTPTKPENTPTQPETTPTKPENTPTKPENTPTKPENAPTKPENTPTQPDNAPSNPETAPTQPENAPSQPENKPPQTENTPTKPENTPTLPETTQTKPENTPTQPENTPSKPENAPTQPENTPTQPDNAPSNPENAPTQPDNAPAQPENTPAEPLDADAFPETAAEEVLPVAPEVAEAIADVAEAQAQALNEERNDAIYSLPAVELDETVIERDSFSDDLDRLANLRDRNWNAFREEGEKELSLSSDDRIDGIYRDAIEAYFRVISRITKAEPQFNAAPPMVLGEQREAENSRTPAGRPRSFAAQPSIKNTNER